MLGGLGSSCRPPRAREATAGSDAIVATYRGGEIRERDLAAWKAYRPFLTEEASERKFGLDSVEMLAVMRVLAAQGEREGLAVDPAVVFERRSQEDRVLASALELHLERSQEIPPAEVDAELARYDASRQQPEQRRLRYILEHVPANASPAEHEAARQVLEAARRRALAGEDFAALAQEVSDSPTRYQGGLLGMVAKGKLPPAIDEPVFALPQGGVSEVLEAEGGLAIFYCDLVQPGRMMPVEEARRRIEGHLRRQRGEAALEALRRDLTAGRIEHDTALLGRPDTPAGAVVSRFGGDSLTRGEVNWVLAGTLRNQGPQDLPLERVVAQLDAFATRRLLAEEARRHGLDRDPATRQRLEMDRLMLVARAALQRALEAEFGEPTEAEVRRLFESDPEAYQHPERWHLAVLWQPAEEEATRLASFRALNAAVEEIRAGRLSFAEAAAGRSAHPSAAGGGELGWRTRQDLAGWGPVGMRSILDLEPGEVSEVVQDRSGFWVFHLLEHEPARPMRWEEAAPLARQALEQRLRGEQREAILERTLAGHGLERRGQAATP